ncbi:MAG: hypothetical protein AB6733_12135 [Clostridiaceae bacterium]
MGENEILEALKQFITKNITRNIKVEKPPDEGNIKNNYELVNPAVYIGWIPPKNYLTDYGYTVPGLLIMSDGGEDSFDEAYVNIRIGITTYDPGFTDSQNTIPNTKGYKDLINIIQKFRLEIAKVSTIENITTIQGPIKWGVYEEQNYPFWNAWITFQASIMPLNFSNVGIENYL